MDKILVKFFIASALILSAFVVSCEEETPDPGADPVAGFTFMANELSVSFTNTSTDATSYSWDFGNGQTSTEANPSHTFEIGGSYEVELTAINGDKSDTETATVTVELNPENQRKTDGFVVVGQTEDQSWFAQYFEELPDGTVDITQGTAFQQFFALSVINGAIYLARTDGSPGFAKLGINGNGEFVEDGIISTVSAQSFVIAARDAEFGVFHDRADPDVVNTFNPTTMQVTGSIDMSLANAVVDTAAVRYQDFIFRGTTDIFAPMREDAGGNVPNMTMGRINISAGAVTENAVFEGLGGVFFLNSSRFHEDENGNLYITHTGNISIPTVSGGILKIPAGSNDYDPNYEFKVPEVNNPAITGLGSFMTAFNYYQNDIGFALINEELDPRILQLVNDRGGFQNLTPEDFQQIQQWLFTSPTGAIVKVNVVTQTVEKIDNLPPVSVFDNAGINFLGGTPYFSVSNPNFNSLFRYNEADNTVTKVFDMTGAAISTVIDLSATIK
ncbi:MAG: PKD domain-containing protein [Bacteroidota bacterium]